MLTKTNFSYTICMYLMLLLVGVCKEVRIGIGRSSSPSVRFSVYIFDGVKMATRDVYCVCGQPYDETRFMIQCDACREWFHGR